MNLDLILFLILSLVAIGTAMGMLLSRNAVYSALFLVLNFITVAVFYLLLGAPFIAMSQITVYAGAIMVLFLFVIMFLNPTAPEPRRKLWWGFGSLAAFLLAASLAALLSNGGAHADPVAATEIFGSPEALAKSLFTEFVLPFEIASVLLLVAIIGAVVLAKREP